MYGTIGILLLLAVIPFLFTEAYANHLAGNGFNDVFTWREVDTSTTDSVFCTFNGVMISPFDEDNISFECKHRTHDGLERFGALFIMKVFDKIDISNGTSNVFTWNFDHQCTEANCEFYGMSIMDGAYDYTSLDKPNGFPSNLYLGDTDVDCGSPNIAWEDIIASGGIWCLGDQADLSNILGVGHLGKTGTDETFVEIPEFGLAKGTRTEAMTITNALWTESTQNQFTVFLTMMPKDVAVTNHFIQPKFFQITNTDFGTLRWNFPVTELEADDWLLFGGAGDYQQNGTESDHGFFFSFDPSIPDPPTNLFAIERFNEIDLIWTAPIFNGFSPIIGYKIERESPIGDGFTSLVPNTGDTLTTYTDTTIIPGQVYNYRVSALNIIGSSVPSNESKDGTGQGDSDDIIVSCDGVPTIFSLAVPVIGITDAILCWNGAILNQTAIIGYQVNFTTPWSDDPLTIAKNNTGNVNQATLSPLSPNTPYSVRVQSWYNLTASNVTNVVNFTTRGGGLEIGDLVIPPDANPLRFDYIFTRIDVNVDDVILLIEYPNSFDPTCVFDMKFARNNQTFSNITTVPHLTIADRQIANFTFLDYNDEIVTATCTDGATNSTGAYILYQSILPLKLQIDSFRDGTYGTMGMFGFFDFFTLGAMFFAMIGFNRVHPGVGVIFAMMILGVASYLGFVENIFTTATIGIIMTIVIVAVLVHHRNDVAN